jgi:hypothetical protein
LTVSLEFWHLVLLCMSFFAFLGGCGKVLLNQIDKRLDARFLALDEARKEADAGMKEAIKKNTESEGRLAEKVTQLEISLIRFEAKLPVEYVMRDDYIRKETVIEAKLDRLYNLMTKTKGNSE